MTSQSACSRSLKLVVEHPLKLITCLRLHVHLMTQIYPCIEYIRIIFMTRCKKKCLIAAILLFGIQVMIFKWPSISYVAHDFYNKGNKKQCHCMGPPSLGFFLPWQTCRGNPLDLMKSISQSEQQGTCAGSLWTA